MIPPFTKGGEVDFFKLNPSLLRNYLFLILKKNYNQNDGDTNIHSSIVNSSVGDHSF